MKYTTLYAFLFSKNSSIHNAVLSSGLVSGQLSCIK